MPRTDVAQRTVPWNTRTVYAAMVDPDALVAWLPPANMSGRFEHFDPRPGGGYRLLLTHDDGSPGKTPGGDVVDARFLELTSGVRVVQTIEFESDDPSYAGTMTMTWELTPMRNGTRVEIRAADVPDGISADDHAAGLDSSLENLEAYLAARP